MEILEFAVCHYFFFDLLEKKILTDVYVPKNLLKNTNASFLWDLLSVEGQKNKIGNIFYVDWGFLSKIKLNIMIF